MAWDLNGDQVHFQYTHPNLFVSTQVTKELKIGKLSPKWRHLKKLDNLFDYVLSF